MYIEESEVLEVTGTRKDLEAEVRRVGLVGDLDNQYGSLDEFLDSNDIQLYGKIAQPAKISVEDLVKNWL